LRPISTPLVLGSLKSGAGSPTSTAAAGCEVLRIESTASAIAHRAQLLPSLADDPHRRLPRPRLSPCSVLSVRARPYFLMPPAASGAEHRGNFPLVADPAQLYLTARPSRAANLAFALPGGILRYVARSHRSTAGLPFAPRVPKNMSSRLIAGRRRRGSARPERGIKVAFQSRISTVRESNATLVPRLERHGPSPADQNHAPVRRWPCPGGSHYVGQDETTQDAPADPAVRAPKRRDRESGSEGRSDSNWLGTE